jgi:LysR family transcriptional regulator of gallate degradation
MNPFDLNLRHLRALSEIVSRGSTGAAAEAVSLSQPALTQGLHKMERQLGAALFLRRADGTWPTAAGLTMASRADAALEHLRETMRHTTRRGGRGFASPEHLMTATQLHAVLSLADAGSFSAASTATRLSQPTLHRAVRDLEQIIAMPIAERHGRGVVLTRDGRRLARGIRLAALELAAGIIEVSSDPHEAGRITIGAMPLCRALVLPHAIAVFAGEAPHMGIDVREGSWRELVESLYDGSIDLMIGALRSEPPAGLEQYPLFEDRLVVVGRARHPLAAVARPALDDLRCYGWIVGQSDTPLRSHWEKLFAGGEIPPTPIECGSVMVIRGVLCDSDYLTLLSPDQIALEVASGVLSIIGEPLTEGVRTIGITTRAGWRPTAGQRRFVELVKLAAAATRIPKNL